MNKMAKKTTTTEAVVSNSMKIGTYNNTKTQRQVHKDKGRQQHQNIEAAICSSTNAGANTVPKHRGSHT